MALILISIASLGVIAYLGYRIWYLAGTLAEAQEYIEELESTNQYMFDRISKSYTAMNQIDRLGAFEKDDEAGTTFALLKQVVDELKEEFDGSEEEEKK
jgi:hypothetical protein